MTVGSFDHYVESLSQLSNPFDPTVPTAESEEIRTVATQLAAIGTIDRASLAEFIRGEADAVPVLGLAVGLTREKLKNILRHHLGSSGWITLARERSAEVVAMLDDNYDVVRLVDEQRSRTYDFGDVLVARAGTRRTATDAGATGRRVEDEIEQVATDLKLPSATRTRFEGRNGQTAPCDLAIPAGGKDALIVVAAKGFDSTGSKLTDAVREVEEMAEKRLPTQFVMAAIDGIGWKSRLNDLRRIYDLRASNQIDGMYTLEGLGEFRTDLEAAAKRLGLI
ncbi:hypothetical protein [Desertimonas flava]|uniref:hypothetical protein n=1 Tax=Desertimonas flava TaxID=2064846 RepID=UPI000E35008C|nr:hypothetical protein [Desertimonas flava]